MIVTNTDVLLHDILSSPDITQDNCGSRLSELAATYGIDACMKASCTARRPDLVFHMIMAGADCHQEVIFKTAHGEKTGSLIDLCLNASRQDRVECPPSLLKLLLSRGVKAHMECTNETVLRYRNAEVPTYKFLEAAEGRKILNVLKEFASKAADHTLRTLGLLSTATVKKDFTI